MRELIVRLTALAAAMGVSLALSNSDPATNIGLAGFLAALSIFSYLLDKRGLRDRSASTILVCLEIGGYSLWLANNGELSRYGIAILIPLLWSVARQGVQAGAVAPIASATIIAANALAGRLPMLAPALLVPAGSVLLIGLLLDLVPKGTTQIIEKPAPEPPLNLTGDDYIELRESYRVLRQRFRDLEHRGERDRLIAQFFDLRQLPAETLYPALAELLADASGADGVAILSVAQTGEAMIVRGATTDFPAELSERAFTFDSALAPRDLRLRLDAAVRAIPAAERRDFANLLIVHEDRVLGMICLGQTDAESLRICREKAEPVLPYVSALLAEEIARHEEQHKLRHAEMLYDLATAEAGDPARIAERLASATDADGLAICSLASGDTTPLASYGASPTMADVLNFSNGTGVEGWAKAGHPEVLILDARNDDRCPSEVAVRRRIGSFCLMPLRRGNDVVGFISATTHRTGGLDVSRSETLRVAAAEVARAFANLGPADTGSKGVLSGAEFSRFVAGASGSLVMLEVLHCEELALTAGKNALDAAIRKLQVRLRRQLPDACAICRRSNGDFLAFLTDTGQAEAQAWANTAGASAALIGVPRLDGAGETPLAVRAKVAEITRSEVRESARLAA